MEKLKGIRRKISHEKEPSSYELNPSEPVFTARYLGKANVVELFNPSNGYTLSCKYAELLLKEKKSGRKPRKIELLISKNISRGLSLTDPAGNLPEQTFQLQNIAFCTTIRNHPNLFTYIAEQDGKLECHAFLCSKNDKARAMCIGVTKAFTLAHAEWTKKRARLISKKERSSTFTDIVMESTDEQGKSSKSNFNINVSA